MSFPSSGGPDEEAENGFLLRIEIGTEPVDTLKLLEQLRNAILTRSCGLVGEEGRSCGEALCNKRCPDTSLRA